MLVKVKTIEQLKQEFIIALRNNCGDKLTKFTPLSVTNGMAYALSKIVQKLNKDAAMIEAKLFPETAANSILLDEISERQGIPQRRGASASSAILLFKAQPGTVYNAGTQVKSIDGVIFETLDNLTIDVYGFGFVLSQSTTNGFATNVSANTITQLLSAPPAGHISVTNPFRAIGGRDIESDYDFRNRLIKAENIISRNTEAFYEALVYSVEPSVLRVHSRGLNYFDDSFELVVVKNSLADYSVLELQNIKNAIMHTLPLSDYGDTKVTVSNIEWTYIDIFVPVKLKQGYTLQQVALDMQIELATFLDLSSWQFGQKVQWDDLLEVCKSIEGVQEVFDNSFLPRVDKLVSEHSLPRIRHFTIKDLINNITIGDFLTPGFWNKNIVDNYYVQILQQQVAIE